MNTTPNTYAIHTYVQPAGTRVGGYEYGSGLHTVPVMPGVTYEGDAWDIQGIVNWVKDYADDAFPDGWDIDGIDIVPNSGRPRTLRVFPPGSGLPIDLTQYESYLDTEEDEDEVDPDFTLTEDDDSTTGPLDVVGPIQQIIQTAAQGLFDNIVANVPQDEADLRQRFEAFGLLN